MAEPEQTGVIKHPPGALTTPCTLLQLHNWMKDAHATSPAAGGGAQITTTATSIGVA